jgi:hypothetical protein
MWIVRICMALSLLQASRVQAQSKYTVALDPFPETVLLGASIPFKYHLGNNSQAPFPVSGDSRTGFGIRLHDQGGRDVNSTPTFVGPNPAGGRYYQLKPGEKIQLHYDLSLLFMIDKPGVYTLHLVPDDPAPQARFTVCSYRALDSRKLSGHYRPPFVGTSAQDGPEVSSVQLSRVESENTPQPFQFLLIDQIVVMNEARTGLPGYSFPVLAGTTIDQAEMDFFGQVWVLVKSADKASLLLWRINDLSWTELIPPTDKKVVLGIGQARQNVPAQKMVIAGLEGKEQFTTYSVAPYGFGGTGKADAGRGRP